MRDNAGFGLEDIARVVLPGYLERHPGIQVKGFSRKFFSIDGDDVEINLYSPGKKPGKGITVLAECKWGIYRGEVHSFVRQVEKVTAAPKWRYSTGDVWLLDQSICLYAGE